MNEIEVDFFKKSGIEVVKFKSLDLTIEGMDEITLKQVMELAREVDTPDAEAVFLSCANLNSLPILDQAEKEFGKYVFNSNIATFWETQRLLKNKDSIRESRAIAGDFELSVMKGEPGDDMQ